MKIAYLGKIQISDTDLPLLHELQQLCDVTYIVEVNPRFLKGPAFNIETIHPHSGLFRATEIYPTAFSRLQGFIDLKNCYVLNTCGRWWVVKSFWTHFLLLLFLIRGKFDAIHLVWPPNLYEFPLYILRRKMLLTVHDPLPHSGLNTRIVRLRRWFAFHLIPQFVLLNKAQHQDFLDYYRLSPHQVAVSRMSSCTYLQTVPPDTRGVPPKGSYVLFAGKISPYKGLDYLLPAMRQVHQHCPDCHLIVAGAGQYHFDTTPYQQLNYIELRNRFIPDTELVALIDHAAFVVCPYTDATQSGVVMSAFAFYKPVIATNVGGLPEMVAHRRHGLIVEERNAEALATAILELWQHQDELQEYARNISHDYSTGELSWKRTAEQMYDEYRKRTQ